MDDEETHEESKKTTNPLEKSHEISRNEERFPLRKVMEKTKVSNGSLLRKL